MNRITSCLMVTLLAAPACLAAQTAPPAPDSPQSPSQAANPVATPTHVKAAVYNPPEPFSRLALQGGIGIGGINMQAAVEANPHLNVRAIGNYFTYSVNNIKVGGSGGSNGVNVSGKLNLASLGIALDYYPFPKHGFRLSPGVMLFNQNGASASGVTAAGASITLDSQKYYSDTVNPMSLNANLGLNAHPQTFTFTTGWGNMISRKGGHWSFPFEIGAIFTGVPTVGMTLAGNACLTSEDAADNGPSCVDMATNATAQQNLSAQIAKYKSDLNPLQVYPILSFGVGYNFNIR